MRSLLVAAMVANLLFFINTLASAAPIDRVNRRAEAKELIDGGRITTGIGAEGTAGGSDGRKTAIPNTGGSTNEFDDTNHRYKRYWTESDVTDVSNAIWVADPCPGATQHRVLVEEDSKTGERRAVSEDCVEPSKEEPSAASPRSPSGAEIRDVAVEHIEPPKVHTNPAPKHGGLTGLENWFWYEGPEKVTAESAVRGYTVTATMWPARFVWRGIWLAVPLLHVGRLDSLWVSSWTVSGGAVTACLSSR